MSLEIQFKIKNDKNYLRFLRENSHWYKYLNRDVNNFKFFEEEVKTAYRLRPFDKIGKALDTFEMFQNLLSSFKS